MFLSANGNNGNGSVTRIGKKVNIKGKFDFKGTVVIDGNISGKIKSDGLIRISRTGIVQSSIEVNEAEISGQFMGEMITTGTVRIKPGGKFEGKLTQKNGASLVIEKGGLLKGKSFAHEQAEQVNLN